MKYDLVRHFHNEIQEDKLKVVKLLQKTIGTISGPLSIEIFVNNPSKITVVGVVTEEQGINYLQIGIARCSPNDVFSKKKGRAFAKWRAQNHPVTELKLDSLITDTQIQELFYAVSSVYNNRFKENDSVHFLTKLPDELKHEFAPNITIKTRWTEEMIDASRAKSAMMKLHEKIAE